MSNSPVMSITEEQLNDLQQRAEAATPGPWSIIQKKTWPFEVSLSDANDGFITDIMVCTWSTADDLATMNARPENKQSLADAAYIAAANPSTVAALIAALREARAALAALATVPDAMPLQPFTTIDRGSKNYAAGWNACRAAVLAAAPAAPVAVQVPAAFYWQDLEVPARKAQRHGPYFGWPTAEALARVGSDTVPVALYTAQPAAEQPDTVKMSRADAEVIASFFETGGSIRLVDAGYRVAHKPRALLGKEDEA